MHRYQNQEVIWFKGILRQCQNTWPLAVNDDSVDKILYIFKAHRVPQGPQKVQSCCLISAYVLVSYSNEQYSKKRKENIHWSLRLSKILKSKVIWASLHWAKNKNQTEVVGNTTANYLTNFLIYRQTRSVVCVSKTVVLFCPKSISIFSSSFIYFSEWS